MHDGLRVEALLVGPKLVEEPADLVGAKALVRDPLERRKLLRARVRSGPRHHHLLVPLEQPPGDAQIPGLREEVPQVPEGPSLVHVRLGSARARNSATQAATRRPSHRGVSST